MVSLKELATNYVAPVKKTTKDICELPAVPTNLDIVEETATNPQTGESWKQYVATLDGQRYKVHPEVLDQLQTVLKFRPELGFVKVTKKPTGKKFKNKAGKEFDTMAYKVEPVL
jgi:hypothetical protein